MYLLLKKKSSSEKSSKKIAKLIWNTLNFNDNIIVTGALGAGKSFFIREILRLSKVKPPIPSPSFSLILSYEIYLKKKWISCHHLDLYRIAKESELFDLGINDYLNQNCLIFIEWANRFPNYFNKKITKEITINLKENKRVISLWEYN